MFIFCQFYCKDFLSEGVFGLSMRSFHVLINLRQVDSSSSYNQMSLFII